MSLSQQTRRNFLSTSAACGVVPLVLGANALHAGDRTSDLNAFIEDQRRDLRLPGLAACIIKSGRITWSRGYGWANVKKRVPMDPDRTVQNLGSISKTVVATAVMQLWEKGKFQLDDDVNELLPFKVRTPFHPDPPITYRLLLTHRSGIADSSAYRSSYVCGDPKLSLESWINAYLKPGGEHYKAEDNFHPWKPGQKDDYSNVGFGLLGYLAERASGKSFPDYTRANIFEPLGMKKTAWHLSEVDVSTHVVPYAPWAKEDQSSEESEAYRKFGLLAGEAENDLASGEHRPLCLYSFPNYPDGSLRTSVTQLARLLMAYANDGSYGDARILAADTVRLMLTPQSATSPQLGLCWATELRNGQRHWGHNGGDPGIRTTMSFRPSDKVGVIVFVNRGGVDLSTINERLFEEAARM